jgi:hypothetical protein
MAIYALLDASNTTVVQYPITIYGIRGMFPNISWPAAPTAEQLLPYHLVIVTEVTMPTQTKKTVVTEGTPVKQPDGTWLQVFIVSSKSRDREMVRAEQKRHLAEKRYEKECGGIMINDMFFATDREAQAKLNTIYVMIKNGLWTSGKWKLKTGKFRLLNAETMEQICLAVANHVKTCFDHESDLVDFVDATEDLDTIESWTWPE